jgi:diacylglycerol kinase family enzyme
MWRATLDALRRPHPLETVVSIDGRELRRRTPFIFVGNNDYIVQGPDAGQRASLDDGNLSVYVLHPRTALGLVWLALRTLVLGVSGADDLDAFSATEFTVDAAAAQVDVARDGEVCAMDTPLRFAVRRGALQVFAPAAEGAA